ncbi:MAG: hypothetical protein JO344_06460, partial [Planctomycetaceae bacterium]|nr:hypothetical protein [Planctomycetaceae bacterium]
MRPYLTVGILWSLFLSGMALGDDAASPQPAPTEVAETTKPAGGAQAAAPQPPRTDEAKLLSAVREALDRNAQEIKSLKEQYAKDMAEQRKKVEEQQKQIAALQKSAQALQDRLKAQTGVSKAPGGQNAQGQDRQQKIADIQQKQIELIQRQSQLMADELSRQGPALENLQSMTATFESRAKQAARRDLELANQANALIEQLDAQRRNGPQLPARLKGMFAP